MPNVTKVPIKATIWTITDPNPEVSPDSEDIELVIHAEADSVFIEWSGDPDRYLSVDLMPLLRAIGTSAEGG
jgi:hypothetical protein